jgi:hypothetical protein
MFGATIRSVLWMLLQKTEESAVLGKKIERRGDIEERTCRESGTAGRPNSTSVSAPNFRRRPRHQRRHGSLSWIIAVTVYAHAMKPMEKANEPRYEIRYTLNLCDDSF